MSLELNSAVVVVAVGEEEKTTILLGCNETSMYLLRVAVVAQNSIVIFPKPLNVIGHVVTGSWQQQQQQLGRRRCMPMMESH